MKECFASTMLEVERKGMADAVAAMRNAEGTVRYYGAKLDYAGKAYHLAHESCEPCSYKCPVCGWEPSDPLLALASSQHSSPMSSTD